VKVQQTASSFVLRPTVAFLIPYLGVCALGFLFFVVLVQFPEKGRLHLISPLQLRWVTGINICWAAALVIDMRRWRSWHISVRKGQLVSVVLALITVLLLQLGFLLAYDPFILDW